MLFAEPSRDKTETVSHAMLDTISKTEDVLLFPLMQDIKTPTNTVLSGKEPTADNVPEVLT